MSPLLAAATMARKAHRYLGTARELEARWEHLSPEQQATLRAELEAVRRAAADVRFKLTAGPRGFAQEFKAARDGVRAEPLDPGKPLGETVKDLGRATRSMAVALQGVDASPAPTPSPREA